jgi:threonine synthase
MWRYAPLLPPANESVVTLGEGWTPLVRTERLGARIGADDLWVKDEGLNPTASFKARGLSCAISMCVELGIRKVVISSAGNAAGAMAAYAAAAGIEAHIFMPRDVPQANYLECMAYGAHVTLVDGLIGDCASMVAERGPTEGWFDVSTLKEPYRIEGKKTVGYEVAEQLDWELPDAIFYPTGGGVGLIGMWKAFEEMEKLGWIGGRRPKMIAVQAEGCPPVVRQSGGTALAVSDDAILEAGVWLAADEGIYAAPEGAACAAALEKLLASGFLKRTDRIVLYNTGSGLKYPEAYSARFPR